MNTYILSRLSCQARSTPSRPLQTSPTDILDLWQLKLYKTRLFCELPSHFLDQRENRVKVQQEAIWLDHFSLAGQCIDIYFCSGCCISVVSLWTTFSSLTDKKHTLAARVDFSDSLKRCCRVWTKPCTLPPPPSSTCPFRIRGENRATFRGLVGEQRQSHRYLSLDSSIYINKI